MGNVPPRWRRIALIGLRGSGKTTIGKLLAARLGWPFVDGDDLIAAQVGRPAGDFLQAAGEERFRAAEREVLLPQLAAATPAVVATGGGAVTIADVAAALRAPDLLVVWLQASPECLAARVAASGTPRPSLLGLPVLEEMRLLAAQREPAYRAAARATVDTSRGSPADAVRTIQALA